MTLDSLTRAWRDRADQRRRSLDERRRAVRENASRVAQTLKHDFEARNVWLFGSYAWGRPHEHSDVDLAVEGIPPERFFAALSCAARVAGEPVDLISLEDCARPLRERIRREGIAL
jgi:predicted nucleotidyltransferase